MSKNNTLDFYHLFIQVWNQKCVPPSYVSQDAHVALDTIHDWIYSWITSIETELEFHNSLHQYEKYFNSVKQIIGDHLSKEVEIAVGRVVSNIDRVGSHKFQRVATLGFL